MRVKRGNVNNKKHKKVLGLTKGFKGGQNTIFVAAQQAMMKALARSYVGRKLKKRDMRGLWIQRINAQATAEGISYSVLMGGLKKANINLNRKMLAEIAINDTATFAKLCEFAKVAA